VVFTWLGRIEGGSGLLEEHLIPIRISLEGQIIGDPEKNLRWLVPDDAAGNVPKKTLEELFRDRFEQLLEKAREEANNWLRRRTEELRTHRQKQAEILLDDLRRDIADRLKEIEDEERRARGLIIGQQLRIQLPDERETTKKFQTRREAVDRYYNQRREEINNFKQVHDPFPPQPLGALFLVREGGAS
jgi:exonuclease VII large subunit